MCTPRETNVTSLVTFATGRRMAPLSGPRYEEWDTFVSGGLTSACGRCLGVFFLHSLEEIRLCVRDHLRPAVRIVERMRDLTGLDSFDLARKKILWVHGEIDIRLERFEPAKALTRLFDEIWK